MKKLFSIAILGILFFGSTQLSAQMASVNPIKNVSAHNAQQYVNSGDHVILDIRTPREYNSSKIKGAINIDFYNKSFTNQLSKLDRNKKYFVYCRSGNRTGQSMRIFKSLGFQNIVHLQRGIVDWNASGYTMVK